jgi:hypothetical protein
MTTEEALALVEKYDVAIRDPGGYPGELKVNLKRDMLALRQNYAHAPEVLLRNRTFEAWMEEMFRRNVGATHGSGLLQVAKRAATASAKLKAAILSDAFV